MKPDAGAGDSTKPTMPVEAARGRTWVTRAGIKVDRMASSWLIRRFIDPAARFKFVPAKGYRPQPRELRFDMFEAEFTHEGDRCTFEVLIQRFGLDAPGLRSLAEIVHDVDLKDAKPSRGPWPSRARPASGHAAPSSIARPWPSASSPGRSSPGRGRSRGP